MVAPLENNGETKPWALSGMLHGLDDLHDSEGRPLGERRASSGAKKNVPLVLKPCPYHDERNGKPINVSALAQITSCLPTVLSDLASFRALQADVPPSWRDMFTAVIDQLSGPARFVLGEGNATEPLPPQLAVGHKLAAGYFGVLRTLISEESQGHVREPTVEEFLAYTKEAGVLIGASESCAGPPVMLAKVTETLLNRDRAAQRSIEASRLEIAQCLCDQILLGLAWELFDRSIEQELLVDEELRPEMKARNPFMEGLLTERRLALRQEVHSPSIHHAQTCLTYLHDGSATRPFARSLSFCIEGRVPESAARSIAVLYQHDEGAVELVDEVAKPFLARRFASYLRVYQELLSCQWHFEQTLRQLLGQDSSTPVGRNGLIVPKARALRWFEATLGHQLRAEIQEKPAIVLANHRRRSILFEATR